MRISTKGGGIIKAQQGTIARPNPKENYKLPEDQRYQAQTRGMKDFAIEWYKERAKQPKYQSQVNESNLANITDQINRAEYVEPTKFYSNPSAYKGNVGNVTQAAQVVMRQNKGAAYPAGLQYTYNAPSFPFSGRFGDVSWHEGVGHMVGDNNPQILKANPGINNREVNSADSAVMEIVKSNMTDMVPFQLLYYGIANKTPTCSNVTIVGIPSANLFTLYVNVGQSGLQHFSLNKGTNQKWIASTLSTT